MCGRYVSATPADELAAYFDVDVVAEAVAESLAEPTYNVAPTTDVPVIRVRRQDENGDDGRSLEVFRWGLVPFWAKDLKVGNRMINARSETVAEKSAFKRSLANRRCIIPADGFYEWTVVTGQKKKQPWYITQATGGPFAFAGLYASWRGAERDLDPPVRSCTILTTTANKAMAKVHDRMPVLLPPEAWDQWLDPDAPADASLFKPAPAKLITMHPVSTDVNNARSSGAQLIEPIEVQATLL